MVYIYEQTSGSLVTLTGAPEPFTTREDDADDIFTPVRTQSGYIRIIDESGGSLLSSIIPSYSTEKLVRLYSGTWNSGMTSFTPVALRWQGFLQTQAYTQPWDGQKNVLEFPIKSLLSALYDVQIQETTFYDSHNVAYLILSAFNSVSISPSSVAVISDLDSPINSLLRATIQYRVFCNEEDISNEGEAVTVVSGITHGKALEMVMALFGLTAREDAGNIYLAQYDNIGGTIKSYTYTWSEITSIAGGSSIIKSSSSLSNGGDISALTFRGTNNTSSYMTGAKTAIVNVEVNQDTPTIKPPATAEDASNVYTVSVYDGNTVYAQAHQNRVGGTETFNYLKFAGLTYVSTSNYTEMLSHCLLTGFRMNWYYESGAELVTGTFPVRWAYQQTNEYPTLTSGLFFNTHYYRIGRAPTPMLCYSISSGYTVQMDEGFLNISFNLHNFIWDSTPGVGIIFSNTIAAYYGVDALSLVPVAIRIGGMFWNQRQRAWVSSNNPLDNIFDLPFTNSAIDSNKDNSMNVDGTDGYFIPVHGMEGVIEFYIFNTSYVELASQKGVPLMSPYKIINNLKVTYMPERNMAESSRSSNIYRQTIAISSFSEEKEIFLDLGTKNNNRQSPTFIMTYDGEYMEEIDYDDNTSDRPEVRLLNRIVEQMGIARQTYKTIVQNVGSIMAKTFTQYGRKFFAVDANHNWRDDEQEVKFIEVS